MPPEGYVKLDPKEAAQREEDARKWYQYTVEERNKASKAYSEAAAAAERALEALQRSQEDRARGWTVER